VKDSKAALNLLLQLPVK